MRRLAGYPNIVVLCLVATAAIFVTAGGAMASETLMKPAALNATAPEIFKVRFETSKGDFVVEVTREWAPIGADRFYNLIVNGFYDGCRFFRVVPGFMAQFGMHGDPEIGKIWKDATIADEPVKQSNVRGAISYAKSNAPDSRTTQLFINLVDNTGLDGMGFAPFGHVVEGMEVVAQLFGGYGDAPPRGMGPLQHRIAVDGNAYLEKEFPKLDYIKKAVLVEKE